MHFPRSSGILMPVFSLPDAPGTGDLGPTSERFVNFLYSAGQSIWQLLPLGPPAKGNSPYSSYSAFAGNPLLISCSALVDDGLLTPQQLADAGYQQAASSRVDYDWAASLRRPLLKQAFLAFRADGPSEMRQRYEQFRLENADWLTDFGRFDALAVEFGTPDWSQWPIDLVHRDPTAIRIADDRFSQEIQLAAFEQFLFASQWSALKNTANARGIRMYGDMPIFVAYESVDVWTNQTLFELDPAGRPLVVAGVPPDYFSTTGQMWGNPLYRWDRLADTDYAWWTKRFRRAFEAFDILRIDHFRGFESYWEIPADADNAIAGHWKPGPGEAVFDAVQRTLGELPIVAEDLGLITDQVHALREHLGFPGMRVLQFGCDQDDDPYHRPDCYPEHCFAYTGTHDNNTVLGWFQERRQSAADMHIVERFLSGTADQVHQDLISAVLNSRADTAIIPMQDLLGLGSEARTNTPGKANGNWNWRCSTDLASDSLAGWLRFMTEKSARLHNDQP